MINVDRAAVVLIRRFGDDCATVAHNRAMFCSARGDAQGAAEWKAVLRRVTDLHFAPRPDRVH